MTRKEVIEKITEKQYHRVVVKDEFLDELEEAANNEGCEWGEQVPAIIEVYRRLQPDYVSEEFAKALHEEIINLYMHMLEYTEIVEYPERSETIKRPASKIREWRY